MIILVITLQGDQSLSLVSTVNLGFGLTWYLIPYFSHDTWQF